MPIFADDEIEEMSLTEEEINQILEASAEIEGTPKINARNAVIYDRTSRGSYIW